MSAKQKKNLIRIFIAIGLLVIAWALPLPERWRFFAFLIPYAVIGWDVLWSAFRNILRGELFDEQFLMAIATLGALALGEYREAVAVMLFYQIGEWFQGIAVGKSRRSIAALMDIRPDYAVVLRHGAEEKVSPEEVSPGEKIIIRPGEKIPLDGIILEGVTAVNAASLTGENLPQDKKAGDKVISGSININGVITVQVESSFEESAVSKILRLVESSSEKKAKVENFITRFARVYTPFVVISALLLAIIPPLFFGFEWANWIKRALIFLVVSCPCALVISIPLTFFGGIGGASRNGILIKGGNYLETLSKVKTIVFDKTGTLTKGCFTVTAVHPEIITEAELLDLAAAAESYSNHPIADSIIAAHGGHINKNRIENVNEIAGMGIEAQIDGRTISIGNEKLMDRVNATWRNCHHTGAIIHLAENSEYLGHIVVSDKIKPDAKAAVLALKELGIAKTVMLTGDKKEVGLAVGREIGIDEIHAELLPAEKVSLLETMLQKNAPLAFVGDGINDAPVLSRADVGIAMGALGSDAAIEAADIVLMDDAPSKLPLAIRISRKTMRIAKQNILFALSIKGIVLILGAAGLANMWIAVFADVGVMILAIINAMRAMRL